MSREDKQLIVHLQRQLEQANRRISDLESELYRTRLKLEAQENGDSRIDYIAQQADEHRKKATEQIAALQQELAYMEEHYAGLDIHIRPEQYKVEIPADAQPAMIIRTSEPTVSVSWVVTARHGNKSLFMHSGGVHTGDLNSLEDEIGSRLNSLLWRAPMLEDIRGTRVVDDDRLHAAAMQLAPHWHDNRARDDYHDKLDTVFNHLIEPHYDRQRFTHDDARKHFRECMKRTFENAAKNRPQMRDDAPYGQVGRRRKK